MAELTEGNVNLLAYVDSRLHGRRFATLGAITQPGCRAGDRPRPIRAVDGSAASSRRCPASRAIASGIVGLRRFANPKFDPGERGTPRRTSRTPARRSRPTSSAWPAASATSASIRSTRRRIPKRRSGRTSPARSATSTGKKAGCSTCACRRPISAGTSATGSRAGTSDTSRFATDHINNPNAINSIFNLAYRPTQIEEMADGSTRQVHHILKDGADSIGVAGRVAARLRQHRHVLGLLADAARSGERAQAAAAVRASTTRARTARTGAHTEARMANAEAFLKTIGADAPARTRPAAPRVSDGRCRHAAPRQDRVCRQVRAVPLEQAAAGRDRDRSRQGRRRGIASRC